MRNSATLGLEPEATGGQFRLLSGHYSRFEKGQTKAVIYAKGDVLSVSAVEAAGRSLKGRLEPVAGVAVADIE